MLKPHCHLFLADISNCYKIERLFEAAEY